MIPQRRIRHRDSQGVIARMTNAGKPAA